MFLHYKQACVSSARGSAGIEASVRLCLLNVINVCANELFFTFIGVMLMHSLHLAIYN